MSLFPQELDDGRATRFTTGILPAQAIRDLLRTKRIVATNPVAETQIQPASLDLRLGPVAYRIQATFLPGPERSVETRLADLTMATYDLRQPTLLERGGLYVAPLLEYLDLPGNIRGIANPRSTTGRLDIFTRLLTDSAQAFETVAPAYRGPLYAEFSPRTFSVRVQTGDRLNQLRFVRGKPRTSDSQLQELDDEEGLVHVSSEEAARAEIDQGLRVTLRLRSAHGGVVGYRARRHAPVIDFGRYAAYNVDEFWERIEAPASGAIILDPGDFYILSSREYVTVPPDYAAEMIPYDVSMGEYRIHYAGFFDPGFGWKDGGRGGTPAVLEVRAHEVPFCMEDGQRVGRLEYWRLLARPDKIYGLPIGSSYQGQGLALSKHFKVEAGG